MTVQTIVKCTRCEGTGVYQDNGTCYRCNGTGIEPEPTQPNYIVNQPNQGGFMMNNVKPRGNQLVVTNNMIKSVVSAIVWNCDIKGARNKMCNVYDIAEYLRKIEKINASYDAISRTLDVLITQKLVRFFVSEFGDTQYYYFSLTHFGWYKWDTRRTAANPNPNPAPYVASETVEETATTNVDMETGEILDDDIPPENDKLQDLMIPTTVKRENWVVPDIKNLRKGRK